MTSTNASSPAAVLEFEAVRLFVERATAVRGLLAKEALVSSVKATLGLRHRDPQWSRTCPPLLPRSDAQTQALGDALRAAGLTL